MRKWSWLLAVPWTVVVSTNDLPYCKEVIDRTFFSGCADSRLKSWIEYEGKLTSLEFCSPPCSWQQDFVDAMNEARDRRNHKDGIWVSSTTLPVWPEVMHFHNPRKNEKSNDH